MNNTRSRNFSLVSYLPFEVINSYVTQPHIDKYAFILHDKDINEDNTLKEPHFHLVITYRNARTLSSVIKEFQSYKSIYGSNTLCELCYSLNISLRYLVHRDDKDKYQYPLELVITNRDNILDTFDTCDNSNVLSLIEDILADVPLREMVRRYGRDFIINYNHYTTFAERLYAEEKHLELFSNSYSSSEFDSAIFNKNNKIL